MSGSRDILSPVHRTAVSAAAMRAAHQLRAAEPKIFIDDFALRLAGLTEEQAIAMAEPAEQANGKGAAVTWALRSRFAEDRLAAARDRLSQYVILGAGLDSYALRMDERLGSMLVYEVDDPPFQSWKRQRIEAEALPLPNQLRFVPCDFEHTSLSQALGIAAFDDSAPCFVSWLGVTQYLTREAIADTLRWAAARAEGSEIVLTFVVPGPRAELLKRASAQLGLNFSTFFSPEDMTGMLRSAGFNRIDHLTPARANEIYFARRTDGLQASEHELLVSATV